MNISAMNSIQHAQYLRQLTLLPELALKTKRRPKNSSNRPQKLALTLAGILAFVPVAQAGLPPDLAVFGQMHEVSDSDLQHMRGKFASNNHVLYFGVEMVSQWQTPAGNLVTAGANLDIDLRGNNGNTPTVHYTPTVTIEQHGQGAVASQSGGSNGVSGGAGLANVSGVSQSIQVAGQSNKIQNGIDMQVDLTSGTQGGSISNAAGSQAGVVSAAGNDGTVATVTLANNSIGVDITVPGQGQVLQQIRDQGMFQSARIGGDMNQIHNAITMHIGLNTATGSSIGSAYAALQGLKGLPMTGMF